MKSLPLILCAGLLAGCGFPDLPDRFTERGVAYPSLDPIDPLLAERDVTRTPDGTADTLAARRDALRARAAGIDTSGLSVADRQRLEDARSREIALAPQPQVDGATLAARGTALRARAQQVREAGQSVMLTDAARAIATADDLDTGSDDLLDRTAALRAHRDRLETRDDRAAVALNDLTGAEGPSEADRQKLLRRTEALRRRAQELRERDREATEIE